MADQIIIKKALFLSFILFAFVSANSEATGPVLAEIYAVPTSGNDDTPHYTFSSTQSGRILYSGDCSSFSQDAIAGNNTVNFNKLTEGTHSNCKIVVVTPAKVSSAPLLITPFSIDFTAPNLTEVSPVPEITNDTSPNYAFSSSETGKINFSGDCYSAATNAKEGTNIITFSTMSAGAHKNCVITIKDPAGNLSQPLKISPFSVDNSLATLKIKEGIPQNTNQNTPSITFTSTKEGSLIYDGDCTSNLTAALSGENTVMFLPLEEGWHKNCTITLKDSINNLSTPLEVGEFKVDTKAPELKEIIAVPTPSKLTTPEYTFSSTEAGNITYDAECTANETYASEGAQKVFFKSLKDGQYSACTIEVTDAAGNVSPQLSISSFIIDTTPPILSIVTKIPETTSDTSPNFTFSSNEAGTITYSGDCKSADTSTNAENKTITFNSMTASTHTNCKLKVTDASDNTSLELTIPSFTVKGFSLPKLNK